MNVMDWLRKVLGYVLLSMGVSRPAPKPKPVAQPAPKPGGGSPGGGDQTK